MQTLNQIVTNFNNIADAHYQINTFGYGAFEDIASSGVTTYPLMYVVPLPSQIREKELRLNLSVAVMDLVHKGNTNVQDVESDMLLLITDILSQLRLNTYDFKLDLSSVRVDPFRERFADEVTGWVADITIVVPYDMDRCGIPTSTVSISANPACPRVTIYDSLGAVVTTIIAGGSYIISACAAGSVRNSDSTYTNTVASGGSLVLADITHVDSDGSGVSFPSAKIFTCTPQIKTTFLNLVFGIGATADYSTTIVSGEEGVYTANTLTNVTSVTYYKNALLATLPITLIATDTLRVVPVITNTAIEARVKLTGTYT